MASTPQELRKPQDDGPRYQPLAIVAAAGCAGIVADRHAALPVGFWWLLGVLGGVAWLLLWRSKRNRLAACALLLPIAACGGAWHHCRWNLFDRNDLAFYAQTDEQPVCMEAIVLSGPRRHDAPEPSPMAPFARGDRTLVELTIVGLRDGGEMRPASGSTRLWVDGHLLGVHAGDRLRIFGQFAHITPPRNPGEFDFAAHYRASRQRGVLRTEYPDCVTVLAPSSPVSVRRWLDAVRNYGDRQLQRYLNDARAGLAAALLLGLRDEVSNEQTTAFMQTGTVHILSISGLHVGILAGIVVALMNLTLAPRAVSSGVVAATVIAYTLLTGAQPPALRAMVIVLVTCLAVATGRRALSANTLAAAGLVVLAVNPADLFRVGAQLSFLCVFAMGLFASHWSAEEHADPLAKLIDESRPWPMQVAVRCARRIGQLALLGATVWLLTLPLVMAQFHLLSPCALLLNVFLGVPVLVILCGGLVVLAFGGLVPPIAAIGGFVCDATLAGLQWSIETVRNWPGSFFWVPGPADWWIAGFYFGLAAWVTVPRWRPPRRWCVAILAGWIGLGFAPSLVGTRSGKLECTFLAVDHGCAVVLRLPSGATMLYDAGKLGAPESAAQSISAALWSIGIRHVDAVVISHADIDHYNALPSLLEKFSVGVVYVSPMMFEEERATVASLRQSIEQAGVPIRAIAAGDRLQGGDGCRIEVLHPTRRGVPGSDNANCLVLGIDYRGSRILLTGDLEETGLNHVLAEEPWKCDIALTPHHGSRSSDAPGLAAWCQPRWAVVSGGRRFDVSATVAAYEDQGAQVVHTGEVGSIRITCSERGIAVRTGP